MTSTSPKTAENGPPPSLIGVLIASGDLFFEWDLASDGMRWTGRTDTVLGVSTGARIEFGKAFLGRIHPEDLPRRQLAVAQHFERGNTFDCEYRLRTETGDFVWIQERAVGRLSAQGEPLHLTGVLRNINDRKVTESQLSFLTTHDPLTGQYNRLSLREALKHAIQQRKTQGGQGGFLLIGLDRLAMLSEAFGEDAADEIVLSVSRRLESNLRPGDIVGRVSFDRFAVVLNHCSESALRQVAGRLRDSVRESPLETRVGPLFVTISAGATSFPYVAGTARDVVAQADAALRNAWRLGCDCYLEFNDVPAKHVTRHSDLAVAEKVLRALREGRILLAYQPIVCATTGVVAYHEALARMREEDGSFLQAAVFVPVVEQMGLMRLVDRQVLDLGLKQLENNNDLNLTINVSGLTAVDSVWLGILSERLGNRPDVAKRLILEITETVALDGIDESSRFVRTLADLGCRVALDDFGAGFTSFRHLRGLPVDFVKIDGSFVRGLPHKPDNQVFVRMLIGLAHGINIATVAECVETEAEAEFLRAEGVHFLQGYHCGRPTIEPPWHYTVEDTEPVLASQSQAGTGTTGTENETATDTNGASRPLPGKVCAAGSAAPL